MFVIGSSLFPAFLPIVWVVALVSGVLYAGGGFHNKKSVFANRPPRRHQKQVASSLLQFPEPAVLICGLVLFMGQFVFLFGGLFIDGTALVALRLLHIFAGVACAIVIVWRSPIIRDVLSRDPSKWLLGLAVSAFVWIARSDVAQYLGAFFEVDGSAMPLTLNAGTVVVALVNAAFAICAILSTLFIFAVGCGARLAVVKKLWGRQGRQSVVEFRKLVGACMSVCMAFFFVVANALGFDEQFLKYTLKLSVYERDALPGSICSNVRPGDKVLFLGPPYDQVVVITPPPGNGTYLGIDRIGPYPNFRQAGVQKCARKVPIGDSESHLGESLKGGQCKG